MDALNHIDFIFLGIVFISAIVGVVTGLVRELITLLACLGALGIAFLTYTQFGDSFSEQLVSEGSRFDYALLIYLVVAIASYIMLVIILSILLKGVTEARTISFTDKLLGLGLGVARGLAIGVLFAFFIDVFISRDRVPDFVANSYTYPYLQKGSDVLLKAYMPEQENTLDNYTEAE